METAVTHLYLRGEVNRHLIQAMACGSNLATPWAA